jgi:hypothetical protein
MDIYKRTGLFTGARMLLNDTETQRFGMIGAFGPANAPGTVRLTLDLRYMAWEQDEESITIELPELWARQLADELATVIGQLQHLRTLQKLGRLTPDALYDLTESEGLANAPQSASGFSQQASTKRGGE